MVYNFRNGKQRIKLDINYDSKATKLTVRRFDPDSKQPLLAIDKTGQKDQIVPILSDVFSELGVEEVLVRTQMATEVFQRLIDDKLV